ncbi:MAG: hypothetical protein M3460_01740 [Actinomycetota bacterium]|nr:hypothetical protein [Actinomycetota bacterium]
MALQVQEHHIHVESVRALFCLPVVVRLTHDLEVRLTFEDCTQPVAMKGVVAN